MILRFIPREWIIPGVTRGNLDPHLGIQPSGTTFVASLATQRARDLEESKGVEPLRPLLTITVFKTDKRANAALYNSA